MMRNKLLYLVLMILAVLSSCLIGCSKNNVKTLESINIDNKAELTAEWYEGDSDRTVELSFSPDSFTVENVEYVISSSNTDVITVNGSTLKAVGAGASVITATADGKSDTVEITVKPVLKGVKITNKDALKSVWLVGDADRTIEVELSPEAFTTDNTEVVFTSSNPDAIEAIGKTLKAKAIGKATITAKAGDFTDTVELSVRPELESVAIANKEQFTQKFGLGQTKKLELEFAPSEYYTAENTDIEVISSAVDKVTINGLDLCGISLGSSVITVKIGELSDTVNAEVAILKPIIEITDNVTEINAYVGEKITLPVVTAEAYDGIDLSSKITCTLSDTENSTYDKESNKLSVSQKGEYTVTFEVADERDTDKKASIELTVNVFRKVFNSFAGENVSSEYVLTNGYAPDAEQTAKANNNNIVFGQFNAEPSKLYYAEATFSSRQDLNAVIGMSHSLKTNAPDRFLASFVDTGKASDQRNFKIKDFDLANDYTWFNIDEGPNSSVYYQYRLNGYRNITAYGNENPFPVKYAVARIGDFFYTFINDAYISGVSNEYFQDKDTVPGLFGLTAYEVSVSGMTWLSGSDAQNKFNELTKNGNIITSYVPDGWALGSNAEGNFTRGETSEQDGLNFTFNKNDRGWNDGLVSPYIYFDGNFTFEWEYEFISAKHDGWEPRMWLDMRNHVYGETCVFFGAQLYGSGGSRVFANPIDAGNTGWHEGLGSYDTVYGTKKFKFSVTRIVNRATGTAELSFRIVTLGGTSEGVFEYSYVWDGYRLLDDKVTKQYMWDPCGPMLLSWHNCEVSGKYTNIKWSVPHIESISITNKEVLESEWFVGDDDRTVELALAPNSFTEINTEVKITSSNPDIIAVEGKTLKAVGAGTATVTVTADGKIDIVEITVRPAIASVTITNKAELTAEWFENGDDRTIYFAISPDSYTESNIEYSVTSSNTEVIAVEGKTLKAVGAGTVTVTVTVHDKSDIVEITVKPILKGIAIANKDALKSSWAEGDADRTVQITFTPSDFTEDNTGVEITSSDSAVVEVVGKKTLKAKGVGEATITVKAGEFTDTVTINVIAAKPDLSSVTIKNKTDYAECTVGQTKKLELEFAPSEYYNEFNTEFTVTSSNLSAVEVEGSTLKYVGVGESTITVTAGDFSDTVNVKSVVDVPTIQIVDGQTEFNVRTGDATTIPAVTAQSFDGNDLSSKVTCVLSDTDFMSIDKESNKLTVSKTGNYSVTYEVVDERDASKKATLILVVNVYRKIFNSTASNGGGIIKAENELVADNRQTAKMENFQHVFAQFDAEPSKLYYAEVTFSRAAATSVHWFGMNHSVKSNEPKQFLTSMVQMWNNTDDMTCKVKDFNLNGGDGWSDIDNHLGSNVYYQNQLGTLRGITVCNSVGVLNVKFAVARIGDFFYTFINDAYITGFTSERLQNEDTVPGLFCFGNDLTISNMSWISGDDAQKKFDSLTANGSKIISKYVPADWMNWNAENITLGTTTENAGVNFTFDNYDCGYHTGHVSPYIYFDGNFTFEWEYEFVAPKPGSTVPRIQLEMHNLNYGDTQIYFGAQLGGDGGSRVFAERINSWETGQTNITGLENFDTVYGTKKLKFSVTRIVNRSAGTAEFNFRISTVGGTTEGVYEYSYVWDGYKYTNRDDSSQKEYMWDPCGAILLEWRNNDVSGKYSNIKWSVPRERVITGSFDYAEGLNATDDSVTVSCGDKVGTVDMQNKTFSINLYDGSEQTIKLSSTVFGDITVKVSVNGDDVVVEKVTFTSTSP